MRVVVLSSGGIDSSVMMHLLLEKGCMVFPLYVDYGQLSADAEWAACQRICKYLNLKPQRIDLSGFGKLIPSGLTRKELDIEKEAFLPTRNLLFLTVGAAYGFEKAAHVIAIGLIANPIFPDQNKQFLKEAERAISSAIGLNVTILAPLISLDKSDMLKLARKHKLPIEETYSCHSGDKQPCGQCISCKERIAAEKILSA
jgi:7-cyano-7-deazaguanine synthase